MHCEPGKLGNSIRGLARLKVELELSLTQEIVLGKLANFREPILSGTGSPKLGSFTSLGIAHRLLSIYMKSSSLRPLA